MQPCEAQAPLLAWYTVCCHAGGHDQAWLKNTNTVGALCICPKNETQKTSCKFESAAIHTFIMWLMASPAWTFKRMRRKATTSDRLPASTAFRSAPMRTTSSPAACE